MIVSNEVSLKDKIEELRNINEKISLALESAENRIDKAIEYIENNSSKYDITGDGYTVLEEDEVNDLLEMLRGKE